MLPSRRPQRPSVGPACPSAWPGPVPPAWLLTSCPSSSYNEFYFLTHPALFIEDHFPDNKNWQLLKPPQSLRQFENNMYHKSEFYNKGMLSAQPQTSIIKTGNWVHGLPCQCPAQWKRYVGAVQGRLRLPRSSGHQGKTQPQVTFVRTEAHPTSINQDRGMQLRRAELLARHAGETGLVAPCWGSLSQLTQRGKDCFSLASNALQLRCATEAPKLLVCAC